MSVRSFTFLAVLVAAMLSSGCAYLTHYKSDLGSPTMGVSVDIKQRMVLTNRSKSGTDDKETTRICAEPSPDAISSLGASVGASFLPSSGSTRQIAAALSESAGYVGLRTQSIQLMRDAMYRACEAYLSGAIDQVNYLFLQRRFQAQVVGLLAIEQLTGTVAAQPVVVYTGSSAGAGGAAGVEADRLAEATKQLASQKVKVKAAEDEQAKAASTYAPLKAAEAKQAGKATLTDDETKTRKDAADAKKVVEQADAQLKLEKEVLSLYDQAYKAADTEFQLSKGRVRAQALGGSSMPLVIQQRTVSDSALEKVADRVVQIVALMFEKAFVDDSSRCVAQLLNVTDPSAYDRQAKLCVLLGNAEEKAAFQAADRTRGKTEEPDGEPQRTSSSSSSLGLQPLRLAEPPSLIGRKPSADPIARTRVEQASRNAAMLRGAFEARQANPAAPASPASAAAETPQASAPAASPPAK